jgi:hypothetical protein
MTEEVGNHFSAKILWTVNLNKKVEGPEKAIRGDEWKPIKIPFENLAYIPKSTRHPSLLTRSRPYNYNTAVGPRNRARNCSGSTE